ncbi:MAG: hypothetical protein COA52_03360 [Hyphomicrobiales bacterium]|nr:MAG: hypothetical protein COA52_03360 [Hyphomicrobiales bacterium]
MEFLGLLILVGVGSLILRYHWLRILFCAFLLAVWGLVALIAPAGLAVQSLINGEPIAALIQFALGGLLGAFWFIAFRAAHKWVKWHIKSEIFWLPWNAQ